MTREQVVEGLHPLLALPVEHLLATHGGPFERAALERALSRAVSRIYRRVLTSPPQTAAAVDHLAMWSGESGSHRVRALRRRQT
ncbi:MAG: hypothetical protein LC777_19250 [Actinobacteria bacterium]|nr:hypothetical protein [Actinomycetota bacterium]